MNKLETAIRAIKNLELWQYGEFPQVGTIGRIQIVITSPVIRASKHKLLGLPLPDASDLLKYKLSPKEAYEPYPLAERQMRQVLTVCRDTGIDMDLRLAVKLPIGTTAINATFSKQVVMAYQDSQDLQAIADDWSGVKLKP